MNKKELRAHLIRCDGKSINGKVNQNGAELLRIANAVGMHPRSIYQVAEGHREASDAAMFAIGAAVSSQT